MRLFFFFRNCFCCAALQRASTRVHPLVPVALAMPFMMSWYPCFKGPALLCREPCSPCIEITFLQKHGAQACRRFFFFFFFSFVLYLLSTEFSFFHFFHTLSLSLLMMSVSFCRTDVEQFFLLATRVSLNVLLAARAFARLGQGAAAREGGK